jgi:hypothetical protein
LRERGIKPHLVKRFSFSNDLQFVQKLTDVAGLYMNPPDNATVLCAGGKSRIQASAANRAGFTDASACSGAADCRLRAARQRFLRRPACRRGML